MGLSTKQPGVVELSLRAGSSTPGTSDILRQVLLSVGVPNEQIIENREDGVTWVSTYFRSPRAARRCQNLIAVLPLKNVKLRKRNILRTHWEGKWKLDFNPFALTRRIDIVPLWRKKDYRPGRRQPVYIDTIAAFGTGLHETTRFMAQIIEENRGRFASFLDIGTGTGILSLVALKSGGKDIVAIDIDRYSVRVARSNMNVNRVRFQALKAIDLLKLSSRQKFDFVAANLITYELIRMRRKIVSLVKPGGRLAVSGVSLENLPRLRKAFVRLPLRCVKVKRGKEWVAVLFQRRGRRSASLAKDPGQ